MPNRILRGILTQIHKQFAEEMGEFLRNDVHPQTIYLDFVTESLGRSSIWVNAFSIKESSPGQSFYNDWKEFHISDQRFGASFYAIADLLDEVHANDAVRGDLYREIGEWLRGVWEAVGGNSSSLPTYVSSFFDPIRTDMRSGRRLSIKEIQVPLGLKDFRPLPKGRDDIWKCDHCGHTNLLDAAISWAKITDHEGVPLCLSCGNQLESPDDGSGIFSFAPVQGPSTYQCPHCRKDIALERFADLDIDDLTDWKWPRVPANCPDCHQDFLIHCDR